MDHAATLWHRISDETEVTTDPLFWPCGATPGVLNALLYIDAGAGLMIAVFGAMIIWVYSTLGGLMVCGGLFVTCIVRGKRRTQYIQALTAEEARETSL